MRLRLPFVYEVDRWSERSYRRANRWAEVTVDVPEVDRLIARKAIRAGAVDFVEMNGRLFRLWLHAQDRQQAEGRIQATLDAMMRREWLDGRSKLLPTLPYMLSQRMEFKNALTFACQWSEERPDYRPGTANLMRERAEQAAEFYSQALVYSPPGLWVEADEPVLNVRPLGHPALYVIECLTQPDLASSGYHFRIDRLEAARAFVAEALRGHWQEVDADLEFEPASLARSDMNRLAACLLASVASWRERPGLVAALLANDPEKHSIAMDAAKGRLLAIAGRSELENPLQRCAVKRWFFEEEHALWDRG